ncbi:unnamed protein product [Rotaria sp. Silwood1]|nr:unnamed protein product [Rotaria sp. Silwood1]
MLFGSSKKKILWRKPDEEFAAECLVPRAQQDGGNWKVWGCMSKKGVGDLVFIEETMAAKVFKNILSKHLFASAKRLGILKTFILQMDNDPKHKAQIVTEWLNSKDIECLPWSSSSSGLNPIEHLWVHVKRELRKEPAKNLKGLKQKIQWAWNSIKSDVTEKLVVSVSGRLQECIKQKGGPTRY